MVRWLFSTNAKDIGTCAVRGIHLSLDKSRYTSLDIKGCDRRIQYPSRPIAWVIANNINYGIADGQRSYNAGRSPFDMTVRELWNGYAKKLEFFITTYKLLQVELLLLRRISREVCGKHTVICGRAYTDNSPEATRDPSEGSIHTIYAQEPTPEKTLFNPSPITEEDRNGETRPPRDPSASGKKIPPAKRRRSSHSSPEPKGKDNKAKGNREKNPLKSLGSRNISNETLRTLVQTQLDSYRDRNKLYNGIINILSDPYFLQGCYITIKSKPGNMSRGINSETLDKINFNWFEKIAEELKKGSFNFQPARRVVIPKPGKPEKRPLGVGNPRDKIVQKGLQIILEAIFEPLFLDCSHGFRPHRSTQSALKSLYLRAHQFTWVIQGDMSKSFDRIPRDTIVALLKNHIKCERFLTAVIKSLRAGLLDPETKTVVKPKIGTPQGSVVSPLLSKIVLHELDKYITENLEPSYHSGKRRRANPTYDRWPPIRYSPKSDPVMKEEALRQMLLTPRGEPHDPNFSRMMYIRYADDIVILTEGRKVDTTQIKATVKKFLTEKCGLELNDEKTTTHIGEGFSFLGADIRKLSGYRMKTKTSTGGKISQRANIRAKINAPIEKLIEKLIKAGFACRNKLLQVKALPINVMINSDHVSILQFYNARIAGIENYSFASNRVRCMDITWLLRLSCAKTLARKFKLDSVRQAFTKFGRYLEDPETGMKLKYSKSLKVTHQFNVKDSKSKKELKQR